MARVLGLELGGAKNTRTTLAEFEVYPKDKRAFLVKFHEGIGPAGTESGDEKLIDLIGSIEAPTIGVHAPLSLPPCFECDSSKCQKKQRCQSSDVKWMEQFSKKNKLNFPVGYTQRPIDLYLREAIIRKLEPRAQFDLDDAFGGSRAALTARARFLQKRLPSIEWMETLPKLTASVLAERLGVPLRHLANYRDLDRGVYARRELVSAFCQALNLFVYEKDALRMEESLLCFDAFLSGLSVVRKLCDDSAPLPRVLKFSPHWLVFPEVTQRGKT